MKSKDLIIALIFVLLARMSVFADTTKVMHLQKVNHDIHVDGVIEPVWQEADSVSDFIQYRPYHDEEPSRNTTAKILTNGTSLYCLIVCNDVRKNIQRNTGILDSFGGDVVSLMIDTFGDNRTAYKFAVSASGVRADCRLIDDARNRDYAWDGVWFSDSKIYDWGFVAEMEIPYRSIQYDEKLREWGLDFDRWIPALNEDIYWCRYEENEGQRISKFGRLVFDNYQPTVKGLNLEIFPVAMGKASYRQSGSYNTDPHAGVDIFYNPSQRLTFQLTANPDFAQIEADPYEFNISRYESYFEERRPFFTQGNEIFMPSGRERSSGFYRPLELFYSRRIGRKVADGGEVPLFLGTKAFGRIGGTEYGGFLAMTGAKKYRDDDETFTEPQAVFSSMRLKKQFGDNSQIGLLYVGKNTENEKNGVIDIDGAFRASDWQLSYQVARSYKNNSADFGASAGLLMFKEKLILGIRSRYIGEKFDINQVGFVPWKGTAELTALAGPRWYFEKGYISSVLLYAGTSLNHEKVDAYTDRSAVLGWNMQFRNNWGFEINVIPGVSKEKDIKYKSLEISLSSWFNTSPSWHGNLFAGYSKTYNFSRDYLAFYAWLQSEFDWKALDLLSLGTSLSFFVEGNPDNEIEDVTINTRPFFSFTPVNNLNIRVYVDNLYVQSSDKVEQIIGGFLFSYNFRPKSWIYFAINEVQDRMEEYDAEGRLLSNRLHVRDRVGVLKLKYLFYF